MKRMTVSGEIHLDVEGDLDSHVLTENLRRAVLGLALGGGWAVADADLGDPEEVDPDPYGPNGDEHPDA